MSHPPSSTPAKVPSSVTTYTPAMQDVEMRSQINTLLLREGHITKIQEQFLHSLDAHPANWPSTIQAHALSLLRSGEVTTFPTLIRRVLEDVRRDTAAATGALASSSSNNGNDAETNTAESGSANKDGSNGNVAATNGSSNKAATNGNAASSSTNADGTPNLAIPTAVVESALKLVREKLDDICEVDPDGGAGG